jgi:hypothetical protein
MKYAVSRPIATLTMIILSLSFVAIRDILTRDTRVSVSTRLQTLSEKIRKEEVSAKQFDDRRRFDPNLFVQNFFEVRYIVSEFRLKNLRDKRDILAGGNSNLLRTSLMQKK